MEIVIYFAVLIAAFFFLVVRPQRRRLAAHRTLMESLGVGDEVVTTAGIYGTITSIGTSINAAVDDGTVALQVAPGVSLKVARGAIAHHVTPPPSTEPDASTLDDGSA